MKRGDNRIFSGWPVPGYFGFAMIRDGHVKLTRPWGWNRNESPLSTPGAKRPKVISVDMVIADGMQSLTLAPGESFAADGLSGELVITAVDRAAGKVTCDFVSDGGFETQAMELRLGWKIKGDGFTFGVHAIAEDGRVTLERF